MTDSPFDPWEGLPEADSGLDAAFEVGDPPAEWFADVGPMLKRLPHPSQRTRTEGLVGTSAGRPAESLVNVGGIAPRRLGDSEDSAAVLNLLLANLPLGVGMVDAGGYVVRANDGLEHLLGCSESVPLTSLLHDDDAARVLAGLQMLVRGDRQQWRCEARTPISGLDDRWISLHLIGVASPGQPPGTFMLLVSDIDDRLRHHITASPDVPGVDAETGLLELTAAVTRVAEAIDRIGVSNVPVGVVVVDVEVTGNPQEDVRGAVTYEVRRETARRLASAVRTTDSLAHLGNGRFAAVLHLDGDDPSGALAAVRVRLEGTLAEPIVGGRLLLEPALAFGSAMAVAGDDAVSLIARAVP